ncbi:MAG: acyl-CoA dehydrogenase family protein [Chloroflexota bacterium]|nr:acyl-CoA dehydrogenase family protein [Chloroflexota bacterium]
MDFKLTETQTMLKNAAREFAEGEFDPQYGRKCDEEHIYPRELIKKAAEHGFIALSYPEEYGGQGLGWFDLALVCEEFCRADSTLAMPIMSSSFGSEQILLFGTKEQKKKYLPKIASGEWISCGAYTEPDAGSDAAGIMTTAEKAGDEYVINGTKTFISNASVAEFAAATCVTDKNAPKFRNMSVILVDDLQNRKGVSITDLGRKMGINSSLTCELTFNDCRVPASNLIGKEGEGFFQAMTFFDTTRVYVGAMSIGIAQGAFEKALAYVKVRKQFGQPIAAFQVTQFKIAEMATKIEAARNLVYKAACLIDEGKPDVILASMAKWFSARVAVEVCDEVIQLHGGYGYMHDYDVERYYRDAKIQEIYEGTKEIEKHTIARAVIGKL